MSKHAGLEDFMSRLSPFLEHVRDVGADEPESQIKLAFFGRFVVFGANMLDGVPPVVANALMAELAPGERVLWHAMPSVTRLLRHPLMVFVVAAYGAVILIGAILFHRIAAPLGGFGKELERASDLLLLFYLLLLAVLLLSIWRMYRRIIYAITGSRAIVIQKFMRKRIQSFTGEQLIRAVRIEDKHGGGDIIFERNIGFRALKEIGPVTKLLRQVYEAGLSA